MTPYNNENVHLTLSGYCPVQGEGTLALDGTLYHVYFRSRGTGWSLEVSRDPKQEDLVCRFDGLEYGWPDAGWIEDDDVHEILDWVLPRALAVVQRGGYKPYDHGIDVDAFDKDRVERRKQTSKDLNGLRLAIKCATDTEQWQLHAMRDCGVDELLWRAMIEIENMQVDLDQAREQNATLKSEHEESLKRLAVLQKTITEA